MTFAILILALIVATCFIAYIADNIGKNLGKKRISIFGLRPRQTATLISMATSVVIMLLTVAILMLTSASLRNALLRYDSEKKAANKVQREYAQLQTEKAELLKSVRGQREQINAQVKEIERNRDRTAQFMKQRKVAERLLKGASTRLEFARKGEDSARARAREAQVRLDAARKRFETFKKQLAAAQAQVGAAKIQVQAEQGRVKDTRVKLSDAQAQLTTAQKQVTEAERKQREATSQLSEAEARLKTAETKLRLVQDRVLRNLQEYTEAVKQIATLETRRKAIEDESETKSRELEVQKREIEQYKSINKNFAAGQLILQRGEVLADETVPPHVSTREALDVLRKLMAEGRSKVSNSRSTLTLIVPNQTSNLTEDEVLRVFAAHFSTLEAPVSLRLAAARDHAQGETNLDVTVLYSEIRTIFAKDSVLASTNIDGSTKAASIFRELLALLSDGERRAGERGVAPLLTAENPHFYPAGTNEQIFEALSEIQSMGGPVRVKLIAANNISSIDFPSVKFEVSRQD